MLSRVVLVGMLCGCQGEPVSSTNDASSNDASTNDAASSDASSSDASSSDASLSDASSSDAATSDAGELAAACAGKGSLVVNGDFSMGGSGWTNEAFDIAPIPGPCGKALRLTNLAAYSELRQLVGAPPLKKGTRYHLRALFRNPGRDAGLQPGVIARFFHRDAKGDEVYTQTLVVQALNNKDWHLVELAVPLEQDEERLAIYVLSEEAKGQTFDLGLVSLVTE